MPCEPGLVSDRVSLLGQAYEELGQLAGQRRERLEDSRRLWHLLWELGEEAAWIREQEQILAGGDCGRDLTSALHLLSKHEAFCEEMAARYTPLSNSISIGEGLVEEGHFGAPEISERVADVRAQWAHLEEVGRATGAKSTGTPHFCPLFYTMCIQVLLETETEVPLSEMLLRSIS